MGALRGLYAEHMTSRPHLPPLILCCLLAYGQASSAPNHTQTLEKPLQSVTVAAPGYVLIDDRWYVFDASADGSSGFGRARVDAMGNKRYFLHGWLSGRSCTSPTLDSTTPQGALASSESLGTEEVSVPIADSPEWPARVGFFVCQGVVTIHLKSPNRDLRCTNPIPQPFTADECPSMPRAPSPTIFVSGFED